MPAGTLSRSLVRRDSLQRYSVRDARSGISVAQLMWEPNSRSTADGAFGAAPIARRRRAHERGMLYFYGESARMLRLSWSGSGTAMACFKASVEAEEIGRPPTACTEPTAKYSVSPI